MVVINLYRFPTSFNTQPPEGGWPHTRGIFLSIAGFNTQPPEGGWRSFFIFLSKKAWFQHTAA